MALLLRNPAAGTCCDLADVFKPAVQFSGYGSTCRLRKRSTYNKSPTVCQRTRRSSWKSIALLWDSLSAGQKNIWKTLALATPFLNKCSQVIFLSAYQMFCRVNGVLLDFGAEYLLPDAPASYTPPASLLLYSTDRGTLPYSPYSLLGVTFIPEDDKGLQIFSFIDWEIPISEFPTDSRLIYSNIDFNDPLGFGNAMLTKGIFTSPPVVSGIVSLCFSGTYIYGGISSFDGTVFKVNPLTMMLAGTYQPLGIPYGCQGLCSDGTYLYAGFYSPIAHVDKINPIDMSLVNTWPGTSEDLRCTSVCHDGAYLYAGSYYGLHGITKIDPATMVEISSLPDFGLPYNVRVICNGPPGYIYAGLDMAPGIVVKIDTAGMSIEWFYWFDGYVSCSALEYRDNILYAGFVSDPAVVVKLDADSMEELARWTGEPGETYLSSLTSYDVYLYAGLYQAPGKVIQIDPVSMVAMCSWQDVSNEPLVSCLASGQDFIYAGYPSNPAKIFKIEPAHHYINIPLRHAWKQGYGRQVGSCPIQPPSQYGPAVASLSSRPKCTLVLRTVNLDTGAFLTETLEELAIE